ncbi:PLP-dependent aspartate aminotransferase family protein [Clostridium sp. LY3-2]|uniref:trans-sulfuration enzyme family protein n=2 Tax=Clostridium TaxID=1485 RepID=UPI00215251A7|nr:PLP-dependent aspartate aminotransferase family protein [Clostridium sp. LY3-2]MCR6513418.1 PLP-dependent aspartate aminotransferase family protein [Clostridium sp. LY3-2]
MNLKKDIETILVRGASLGDSRTGAMSFPIYQSATFKHPGLNMTTGYDYSRANNPTREELEKTIALLEEGCDALAFSSGVSAIASCISTFSSGDHFIVSEDLYGGTYRLFEDTFKSFGIKCDFVDTSDREEIRRYIKKSTKAIFVETPSNPLMRVSDIKAISEIAKENGLILIVDNTFLTPYFQKPLSLGADIVVHSGTKFLGGHNDLLAGLVIVKDESLSDRFRKVQMATGSILSPFDSWLLLRSLKTLHIRMERCEKNALEIANYLKEFDSVSEVFYVGLKENKGYEINKKQSIGSGAMISFKVKDEKLVEKILNGLEVISFAESLGGTESLITYPFTQTHADMPSLYKEKLGIDNRLLRLSVGIENINDLKEDLRKVLEV